MGIMMHHVQCMMWHNFISTELRSYQSPFCRCWFVWDKGRLWACFWISSQCLFPWKLSRHWYELISKKKVKNAKPLTPQHFGVVSHNLAFTKMQRFQCFDRKYLYVENVGHTMLIHQPLHQSFLEAFLSARHCQRNLRSKGLGGICFEQKRNLGFQLLVLFEIGAPLILTIHE